MGFMGLTRSETMSRIRARNTKPEMAVRRALHAAGLRYRLHVRKLPGTPDIVLSSRRTIVEVRGCFWHQHARCPRARIPATRQDYWLPKLARNIDRDRKNMTALHDIGWHVVVIWECQINPRHLRSLAASIKRMPRTAPIYDKAR